MKKWIGDRPWIWIIVFFGVVFASTAWMLWIAHANRPIVISSADDGRVAPRAESTALRVCA